jgi:hypothetical protein
VLRFKPENESAKRNEFLAKDLMNWLPVITQISQFAAIVSVIFAALSIRSNTRLSRKQWNVDTFNIYSERYQAVVDNFPDDAYYNRFDESKLPPRSPQLTIAVRKYLFILSSVHYLFAQGYLDDSIWQVWRIDMARTLNSPLITREWPEVKSEFQNFKAFTQFVEDIQQQNSSPDTSQS